MIIVNFSLSFSFIEPMINILGYFQEKTEAEGNSKRDKDLLQRVRFSLLS